ncbi:MAG: hypothetical protein QME81_10655 [bacterium]|nr:hypothetical protein [bacterium]
MVAESICTLMITAYGDIDLAVEAMRLGAADFIQKTRVNIQEIRKSIRNVLEKAGLERKQIKGYSF